MIYLSKPSSFDIKVDNVNHDLIAGESIVYRDVLEGTLEYVRPCLLNTELDVPVHLYRIYQGLDIKVGSLEDVDKNYQYDLLLMPPNVTGVEYSKTHGHATPIIPNKNISYPVIIEVLFGVGTFLFQKLNPNFDPLLAVEPEVSEVYMIKAKKGEKVIIPPGFQYSLINTRNTYLITGRFHYVWENKSRRQKVEEKQGLSYYVIRKNARQEIVMNPNYRSTPKLRKIRSDQTTRLVKFKSSKPLIEIFKKSPEKFEFLIKPWKFDWTIK
jgi:oxalate decarboxylase/phosphoglucose isomerase-like protein (cupin superfamily)